MDLLSAVQVLLRRWYVTLPGILITCCLALAGWSSVDPTYQSDGSLLLRPPAVGNDATAGRINPYLVYNNLQIPARVTQDVLTQRSELEALRPLGATGTFEVALDPTGSIPLVTFRAVGDTEEEATTTASVAMDRYSEVLVDRQVREGASEELLIKAEVVRPADLGVPLQGSKIRAVLAALALGGILTLTAAFMVEAVSRRRQASRSASTDTRSVDSPAAKLPRGGAAQATPDRAPVALVPSDERPRGATTKSRATRYRGQQEKGSSGPSGDVRVTAPRS